MGPNSPRGTRTWAARRSSNPPKQHSQMGPSQAHPGPIWGPTLPNWGPTGAHMKCCLGEVVERGVPSSGGSRQDGPSGPEIRLESTKKRKNGGGTGEPRRRGMSRCRIGRSDGPYHFACRVWKHKEPLRGGPVGRPEWTRPEVGWAEEHVWRHQRMDWYYIGGRRAHGDQFNRASRTNCQPASLRPAGCPEKDRTRRRKYRAPSAGVGYTTETCGSTNGACTRGYDAEGTSAHRARLKNAGLTPLSKIGRTTSRTPMSSV